MAAIAGTAAGTATGTATPLAEQSELSREDQTLLLFAGLMEGGKEDDEMVRDLDRLTKVLNEDVQATKHGDASICPLIDSDCVDTLLGYLDMRQPDVVRGHATLTTSAYLQAAGDDGAKKLSAFFYDRVDRGTYDDYIVAFCVAAAVFPIVPDLTAEMFLSEGFLPSLGPLMRRKWKSRKVETACLDMLNMACLNPTCRQAVQKYCGDWLEEIVDQDPDDVIRDMWAANQDAYVDAGSVSMRRHSRQVQARAAVILAKIKATIPPQPLSQPGAGSASPSGRVQLASTTIEELSRMFTGLLVDSAGSHHKEGVDDGGREDCQSAVEGLAYASLQPQIKEDLAADDDFLKQLIVTLQDAPPRSSLTYGGLSIFANLTRYQPAQSEEQRRIGELKAYADAANGQGSGPSKEAVEVNTLNDDAHVSQRCLRVFAAGVTPVLVSHSKKGSAASLGLIVGILHALSTTAKIRGQLAQQGAVRLLIDAWTALQPPKTTPGGTTTPLGTSSNPPGSVPTTAAQRTAAQALARILISTNPALVFGGTQPVSMATAIRPLASLLVADDNAENPRDLLPTFEALMALTNLASAEDDTIRRGILRSAWPALEDLLLANHALVARAAVELVCNLVQCQDGVALYADGSPAAATRLHILTALADAEDMGTRSAAGGALAALSSYTGVVLALVARPRGVASIVGLCKPSEPEDLRHRGAVVIYNMAAADGDVGQTAREALRTADAATVLKDCAKASRRPEVVEAAVYALKALVDGGDVATAGQQLLT